MLFFLSKVIQFRVVFNNFRFSLSQLCLKVHHILGFGWSLRESRSGGSHKKIQDRLWWEANDYLLSWSENLDAISFRELSQFFERLLAIFQIHRRNKMFEFLDSFYFRTYKVNSVFFKQNPKTFLAWNSVLLFDFIGGVSRISDQFLLFSKFFIKVKWGVRCRLFSCT